MKVSTFSMSTVGMPSVMQTASGMPASVASMIASAANIGGTMMSFVQGPFEGHAEAVNAWLLADWPLDTHLFRILPGELDLDVDVDAVGTGVLRPVSHGLTRGRTQRVHVDVRIDVTDPDHLDRHPIGRLDLGGVGHQSGPQRGAVVGRLADHTYFMELGQRLEEGDALRWLSQILWCDGRTLEAERAAREAVMLLEALPAGRELGMAYAELAAACGAAARGRGEEVFATPLEQVTRQQRNYAKTINFGVLYGMGSYGLARDSGLSQQEAAKFIELYWSRYPAVRQYMDQTLREGRERGYVSTLFGRRRYMPELRSRNGGLRQQAERMAINAPVQGTAADIIKVAMNRLWRQLRESGYRSKLLLQVHDELLFEVPVSELQAVGELVCKTMESAIELSVPLVVEVKYGKNWGEMKPLSVSR